MLHVLKHINCPSCELHFTGKDGYRTFINSRYPLLLKCGHTHCESCINTAFKAQKSIKCAVCKKITNFDQGSSPILKLLPDVHALGIVNAKQALPSLKNKLVPAVPQKSETKNGAVVTCERCKVQEASFRCKKCEENFCNICFDSYHKNSKLRRHHHIAIPIYADTYHSLVQEGCTEHNRAIEFYCEDDNMLTCSYCVITGTHKGHNVITLKEKNQSCVKELKSAYEEALGFSKRLKFTEQKLSQAIPTEKVDCSHLVKEIRNHFHYLHSILLLRENELLQQIEDISNANITRITKLRQEASDTTKDVEALLRDAVCAMENPTISISVPVIIKKLMQVKNAPCHLLPVGDEGSDKEIDLSFQEDLHESILRHGKITADIKPKYCLRGNHDLPVDYIVEPLPQELANIPDTESLASDTFSEDSLSTMALNESESLALLSKMHTSPKREKPERVVVTHIVDPTLFFVRKCKDDKKLCHLTTKIVEHIRSKPHSKTETQETMEKGNIYLVRFTKDDKWYRGRFIQFCYASDILEPLILSVSEPEDRAESKSGAKDPADIVLAEVYYIDFGNSEIVPLSRIRPIEREMTKYPGLVKKCSLHNIVPIKNGSWTLEAKTQFQEFVFNKEINMQIIEDINGVLYVDLCQLPSADMVMDVPISVRDALIFLEYGTFFDEKELLKAKKIRKFRHYLPPESVNVNSRATVNIPCIESPSLFYVQQSSSSHHLSELLNEMLEAYSVDTNLLHAIYVPYIGMICAAQLPDSNWYRAEVLGLPGGAKVEVELVDFGSKQILHHQCLRQLLDKFTKLTRQALPCTLADVAALNGDEWSEESKDWLNKYTNQKRFTLLSLGYEPGSSKTRVVLYDTEGEVEICVNALMVTEGMAVGTGKYSTVAYKRKEKTKAAPNIEGTVRRKKSDMPVVQTVVEKAANEVSENFYEAEPELNTAFEVKLPKPKNQLPKEHVKVVMGYAESPGLFYIRIFEYEEDFKRLVADMQETYTNFESSPVNVEISGDYAAYQESEKTWCRVIVQSVVDVKTVEARFLDYGHSGKVPVKNLRPLLPKFKNDRAYVISCYLSGITPAGDSKKWSRVAVDLFLETIAPYQVLYLVQSPEDDFDKKNPLPSDLFYEEIIRGGALEPSTVRYSSVTKVLIDAGVALPIRRKKNVSETSPVISSPQSLEYSSTSEKAIDFDQLTPNASQQSSPKAQKVPRLPSYQWLPAKMPRERKFKAYGTHVGHDGCIYLQISPDGVADANFIKSTLQVMYENSSFEHARIAPPIGEACIALFDIDKKYYRAETVTDDPQRLKVQFVDYGNFEIVNLKKIQVCTITCEMPRQCIECELVNVDPPSGSWPSNVLNYIHENIVETLCDIEVVEPPESGKRLQIQLNFPRGNLNSLVASIFHVKKPALQNGPSSPSCSNASVDDDDECFAEARPLSRSAEPFPVCVIQIVEPTVVYIQATCINPPLCEEDLKYNEKIEEFLKLLDHLAANGDHFPLVLNPTIGTPCIARYSYDNKWYRCVVVDIKGDRAIVRYVDYGNVERVQCGELRKPDFYTLNFPVQAHLVKVKDLEPATGEWTDSLGLILKKVFDDNEGQLYARVISKSDIYEVELLLQMPDGSFVLAYEDLIREGVLKLHES